MRKYLKDLRKQAGLNQTQVAEKLGLSQPSIVMIENGRNKVISTDIANKLARLYDCDVRTIIESEEQYLKTRRITNSNKNKKNLPKIQKIS